MPTKFRAGIAFALWVCTATFAAATAPPYTGISQPANGKVTQYLSGNLCVASSSGSAGTCNVNVDGTDGLSAKIIDGSFLNVMSPPFNAKCDGVTHDDAAFALAISSAYTRNGGTIIVPGGQNYCVIAGSPGISIQHPHIHIKGTGYGWAGTSAPVIQYIGISTGIVIGGTGDASDTQIEDLAVIGSSAAKGGGIVFVSSADATNTCYQCNLNRVAVQGFVSTGTAGIWLEGGIMDTFRNVSSFANYYGFYVGGTNATSSHFSGVSARVNKSYGMYVNQNTGILVDGMSLFESNADAGVALMGNAATANYSMFFHDLWFENNLTGYLTNITTASYQFQFLTNPTSPAQGLLRNVEIKNAVFGTQTGKGDIDVASADAVRIENIQSSASSSSDCVRVELTATNVSLINIYNSSNGKIDALSQAAWNLSSGTVHMWGNLVSSGNVTMGTTLKMANNSTANNILAQGSSGRLILDGDGGGAGAELTLNGSLQGASAGKMIAAASSFTVTALNGVVRFTIDGSGNLSTPNTMTAGTFVGAGTGLTGTGTTFTAAGVSSGGVDFSTITTALALKAPIASPTFTGSVTMPTVGGATTFTSSIAVVGVTDGSVAGTGKVGELLSATGSGNTTIISNRAVSIATITLTAGDWDITGNVAIENGGTTVESEMRGSISNTADTMSAQNVGGQLFITYAMPANGNFYFPIGPRSVSVATTTNYYIVALMTAATPGGAVFNKSNTYIQARRIR